MLEQLFAKPAVIARHKTAPMAEEREKFLAHLADQGYKLSCLRLVAALLFRVAWVLENTSGLIGSEDLGPLARRSLHIRRRAGLHSGTAHFQGIFHRVARQWLQFLGRWRTPPLPTGPLWDLRDDFMAWMDQERGFSRSTIRTRRYGAIPFILWWEAQKRPLSALTVVDMDEYVSRRRASGLSRVGLRNDLGGTRAFLRHAERRGLLPLFPAGALRGPRIHSQEGLPKGPSRPDVERLLSGFDTVRPVDIRDRAILILFAVYGLRAGEVSRLHLEDVDWDNDTITVDRTKQRRRQTYPLLPNLGRALLHYVRDVRPSTTRREIFLKLFAPVGPMSSGALYCVVSSRFARANVKSLHRGPHALRHACASHLLSEGLSLHAVAGHLGHQGMNTVGVYAKVDMPALRDVAAFDLGEAL
jgi:integrase/recombinase XerD